ncbi:four helix bundle protein [Flavobacteriaceae bacterium 3-367]|uniref:four helix bundle protein n=1 Tax=Eudoraea algarum TaxID=3417568 RepID=UPI00328E5F5F
MATIEKFEDLEIWQLAREICDDMFKLIQSTSLGNDYALRDQINRSSGSVMDNIAEGFERNGNKEFIQFLSISKASCGELRSQLYRALDRKYLGKALFEKYLEKLMLESKKISSFIKYLNQSEYKGSKYNRP